jgi:HAD superfamily hydrolase (TIGR01490 family)
MSVHRAKSSRNGRSTPRAAFYDLDGTLVDLNLVHIALYVFANLAEWSNRLGYLASFAVKAPQLYLAEQNDRRVLNVVLFESFKGVSRDRLAELGEEYCERVLMDHLYPQGLDLIDANRRAGLDPVLVTGSPDFVIAPLARRLGIDNWVANRMAFNRGRATGRLIPPIIAGEEKADWCERYASEHNLDLADCWGYADSIHDLAFLAALGHPVAVNPDRKLRATAVTRHWPVMHFEKTMRQTTLGENVRRLVETIES